jgi:hypothetical protein
MSESSPQPSAKDWQAVVARFNAEHDERFDPTYRAKHAALELAFPTTGAQPMDLPRGEGARPHASPEET